MKPGQEWARVMGAGTNRSRSPRCGTGRYQPTATREHQHQKGPQGADIIIIFERISLQVSEVKLMYSTFNTANRPARGTTLTKIKHIRLFNTANDASEGLNIVH